MGSGNWQWMRSGRVLFIALVLGGAAAWAEGSGDGHQSGQGTKLYGIDPSFGESLPIQLASARYMYRSSPYVIVPTPLPFTATLVHGQLEGQVVLPRGAGTKNLAGEDFNSVTFTTTGPGNETVTLSLSQAQQHHNVYQSGLVSRERWDYQVRWSSSKGSGNLCPKGTSALVVPYTGVLGNINPTGAWFSFACLPQSTLLDGGHQGGGVAAKCSDWGYSPWWVNGEMAFAETLSEPMSPDQLDDKARRYHVACTAMATADYCGEGAPHTLNNTPIVMFDTHDVKLSPADNSHVLPGPVGSSQNFFLEAAWTAEVDPTTGSLKAHALCLTKKRWSTFPVSGVCTSRFDNLPDPRDTEDSGDRPTYCDDVPVSTLQELLKRGALLFSYSMFMDAGLYRFKKINPDGSVEFLTTAEVSIDPGERYPNSYQPDFAQGYELDVRSFRDAFEGTVITENGRQSQVLWPVKDNLHPLWRVPPTHGSTGYLTLVDNGSAGTIPPDAVLEGHVYLPDGSLTLTQMIQVAQWPMLKLWSNGENQVTSIDGPGYPGYQSTDQGYVPSLVDYSRFLPQ